MCCNEIFDFSGFLAKMAYFTNQNGGETVNISPGKIDFDFYFFDMLYNV